jgi:glycosyltransferase involved in cell wall biosynthesis
MLPLADLLLTISRYSAEDLRRLAARQDLDLPPLRRVHLGVGLPRATLPPRRAELAPLLRSGGYLLTVGSLAPSKNHAVIVLALALLAERGRALPPLLWLGRDVERAGLDALLARHPAVARQVRHLQGLDDHDLALAYAHCRLTIFPSFFEGFGLPVAESLAFGKVCLASNACSIPEAGGDFADYFAPDDPAALAALIERYLDDRQLARRAAQIRRGHRATTWQATCRQLYAALGTS